jgi:hypothetical protein
VRERAALTRSEAQGGLWADSLKAGNYSEAGKIVVLIEKDESELQGSLHDKA